MVCQRCGTTSTDGNKFCPNCGAATGAGLDPVLLEEIEQKIKTALDARLTDQRIVEIDIQEKVVDRLKNLAKIVGIPLGLLLALLGAWGIKSLSDVNIKVTEETNKAVAKMNEEVDAAKSQAITALKTKVDGESTEIVRQAQANAKATLEQAVNTATNNLQLDAEDSRKRFDELRQQVEGQAAALKAAVDEQNRKLSVVQSKVNRLTVEQTAKYESGGCSNGRCNLYQDNLGVWVIGYGHALTPDEYAAGTIPINGAQVNVRSGITEQQALDLLRQDLDAIGEKIDKIVTVKLTSNQKGALVDFAFNMGLAQLAQSTLLKKLNTGDYASVPAELMKWNKAAGREIHAMTVRRQEEVNLWNTP